MKLSLSFLACAGLRVKVIQPLNSFILLRPTEKLVDEAGGGDGLRLRPERLLRLRDWLRSRVWLRCRLRSRMRESG